MPERREIARELEKRRGGRKGGEFDTIEGVNRFLFSKAIGLIILFLFLPASQTMAQEELPFWHHKPDLVEKMTEQRKIVVSVTSESVAGGTKVGMLGAGVVNVPLYFAKEQVLNFEKLPEISSYFKKVVHKKEKKEVYFHIRALGMQMRFIQKYKWGKTSLKEAQMDWKVTWGLLKGRVGHYKFRYIEPTKTEINIWSSLVKSDIPIPQFLVNFTLEVIAEKVAQKMRTFMEENFRQSLKTSRKNGQK